MKFVCVILQIALLELALWEQSTNRWSLLEGSAIRWDVKPGSAHSDTIEMSGLHLSAIIQYGMSTEGRLVSKKKLVFPMLRRIPNDTHASLLVDFDDQHELQMMADGVALEEHPKAFTLDGKLAVTCGTRSPLETTRVLFLRPTSPLWSSW